MRLIVIGGGAAGFFCAVTAAADNPQMDVIILERSGKLLSKVRISGGGRCNVTHACFSIPEIIKNYPRGAHFVKKAFHRFFTNDTINWFAARGVELHAEEDGRMFPASNTSEAITRCLLQEAARHGVQIRQHAEVREISSDGEQWAVSYRRLATQEYDTITADFICIACGGYPRAVQFNWLTRIGHSIVPPVPSLFTFNAPGNPIVSLMGISCAAKIRIRQMKLEEEGVVLITHWGLSGPAVLKLSARGARELNAVNYRFTVVVNWSPGFSEQSLSEYLYQERTARPGHKVSGRNSLGIPGRLWMHLCELSGIDTDERWSGLSAAKQNRLVRQVCSFEMKVEGKTTFKEEFVTAGGIRLAEIDPVTMGSRINRGLFFAGEIMDVDGLTGGFNFQHAWTSGWIAGKSIAAASG